jgi:hypothetical protein
VKPVWNILVEVCPVLSRGAQAVTAQWLSDLEVESFLTQLLSMRTHTHTHTHPFTPDHVTGHILYLCTKELLFILLHNFGLFSPFLHLPHKHPIGTSALLPFPKALLKHCWLPTGVILQSILQNPPDLPCACVPRT